MSGLLLASAGAVLIMAALGYLLARMAEPVSRPAASDDKATTQQTQTQTQTQHRTSRATNNSLKRSIAVCRKPNVLSAGTLDVDLTPKRLSKTIHPLTNAPREERH